jgi:hypothetical protein
MHNFCTLFDSNYLTRGLALYESLVATGDEFVLYVVCFDDLTAQVLVKLDLPCLVPISLESFENDTLKAVKPQRSRAEYCWTCTPHVVRYCLDTFELDEVTYLDADLYFYSRPSLLLNELEQAGGSVLITEHRLPPGDKMLQYGIYCVQFMTFLNDARGRQTLSWWQDRCLEWCYARLEDGKFGDQKYLDDWPRRFSGVHVLEHLGGGVAPWNVAQYQVLDGPRVNGCEVVFYHFHYVRWTVDGTVDVGIYPISADAKKHLYLPYLESIERQYRLVGTVLPGFNKGRDSHRKRFDFLRTLRRKVMGRYHVIKR